jgi:hypothetical protein
LKEMTEGYDQQDGSPQTEPGKGENVSDLNEAHPATIGERSTEDKVAGQGLGQYSGDEGKPPADSDSQQ